MGNQHFCLRRPLTQSTGLFGVHGLLPRATLRRQKFQPKPGALGLGSSLPRHTQQLLPGLCQGVVGSWHRPKCIWVLRGCFLPPLVRRNLLSKPQCFSTTLPFLIPYLVPSRGPGQIFSIVRPLGTQRGMSYGSSFSWPVNTNLSQGVAAFVPMVAGGSGQ